MEGIKAAIPSKKSEMSEEAWSEVSKYDMNGDGVVSVTDAVKLTVLMDESGIDPTAWGFARRRKKG